MATYTIHCLDAKEKSRQKSYRIQIRAQIHLHESVTQFNSHSSRFILPSELRANSFKMETSLLLNLIPAVTRLHARHYIFSFYIGFRVRAFRGASRRAVARYRVYNCAERRDDRVEDCGASCGSVR